MTVSEYRGAKSADGLCQGTSYAAFASGNIYEGDFERGQMHGKGKYAWTDGLVYTGSFVNNRITGNGVSKWLALDFQGLLSVEQLAPCQQLLIMHLLGNRDITGPVAHLMRVVYSMANAMALGRCALLAVILCTLGNG